MDLAVLLAKEALMLLVIFVDGSQLKWRSGELAEVENSQWHCQILSNLFISRLHSSFSSVWYRIC